MKPRKPLARSQKPIRKRRKVRTSKLFGRVRLDSEGMRKLREEAFARSYSENVWRVNICENRGCYQTILWETFHLHHLIHRSQLGSDVIENVAAICAECHANEHDRGIKVVPKWRLTESERGGSDGR